MRGPHDDALAALSQIEDDAMASGLGEKRLGAKKPLLVLTIETADGAESEVDAGPEAEEDEFEQGY